MKYKNGLVLGKFYPFHKGHEYLIESAAKQCERLTILVCSLKQESIPGNLRYDWIRRTFSSPKFNIVHITDDVVQYPKNDHDDFFWDIWIGIIMRELPEMDVVFTSEDYGKQLAQRINFKYPNLQIDSIEVDKLRQTYPVSGTAIRENPIQNWKFLPDVVKPFFMKKIILVGPESTGKTTLTQKLANDYGNFPVLEYGRTYTEKYVVGKRPITLDDIEYIAQGHIKTAEEIALQNTLNNKSDKVLFLDTDLITTQIWSEIYFKKVPPIVLSLQDHYIQKGDLYLLMDIDIDWVDDGTREFPYLRRWHFDRIEQELKKRDLNYVKITGNYDERLIKSIDYIERYLHRTLLENKKFKYNEGFNGQFILSERPKIFKGL